MPRTILTKCNGFTPLIDAMVRKYGLVTAAVFGRVWRYCQLDNAVCSASLETIAAELGLNRRTIMRHIDILVRDGFLDDKTPERLYRPHILADTGRAQLYGELAAAIIDETGVTESHTSADETGSGVTLSPTRCDRESHLVGLSVTPGVTLSHLKIDLKRDLKRELKILDDTPAWDKFITMIKFQLTNGSALDRQLFREHLVALEFAGREDGVVRMRARTAEHAAWLQERVGPLMENWFDGYTPFSGSRPEFIAPEE